MIAIDWPEIYVATHVATRSALAPLRCLMPYMASNIGVVGNENPRPFIHKHDRSRDSNINKDNGYN
jgi:hypothetical protein